MNSIASRLTQDHQELDSLLRQLADDAQAPEPGALEKTWSSFEGKLIRHMEAEERFLLPLLEVTDAEEVARIRLEHARVRDLLTELGVGVELHTVRAGDVGELVDLLHAHAKHENTALYHLAGEKASRAVEHGVAQLLRHGVALAVARVAADEPSNPRVRP